MREFTNLGRNMYAVQQAKMAIKDTPEGLQLFQNSAKRQCIEHVASLCSAQTTLLSIQSAKPLDALDLLERNLPRDPKLRKMWTAQARVAAVMGSCLRSLASFKSGLKHWLRYIEILYGRESMDGAAFPPKLDDVLAWSNTFRCAQNMDADNMKRILHFARSFGTFANYLGYLCAACHAIGCTAPPVGHPAIKRSMIAIVKRDFYKSREKLHLDRIDVRNMVLAVNNGLETLQFAMLWLVSYTFLLRLPSEVSPRTATVHSPFYSQHFICLVRRYRCSVALAAEAQRGRNHCCGEKMRNSVWNWRHVRTDRAAAA